MVFTWRVTLNNDLRIGNGFDVHAFAQNRKLILGGLEISATHGLLGHSDADVLLHALTDAILGALSWGDIGSWFPDNDPQYKDADSAELLKAVWQKAKSESWGLINCDIVVMAEAPKLRPHVDSMKESIAAILKVEPARVGLKATTTESLGYIGRGEGMACSAVVLLNREE